MAPREVSRRRASVLLECSRARLVGLQLPCPFVLEELRQVLEARSGRSLVLHPSSEEQTSASISVRFSMENADHLLYPILTGRPFQDHVILKGLMRTAVLRGTEGLATEDVRKVMPYLAPCPCPTGVRRRPRGALPLGVAG
jgi:hypothetical protein